MIKTETSTRIALLTSAAVFGLCVCTPAAAQTEQAAQPEVPAQTEEQLQQQQAPDQVADNNSEAIVVTAQKRAQVLLEVPSSVTVLGSETLERQQATNFQDYVSLVPGFSLNGDTAGETRITLRGTNTGGVASTVAVFMDEVPFGSSTGLANGAILSGDFDSFDINRIEVLRGPQGTLYGASSFGGVIRYITNAPKLGRFEAKGQAGIENTLHGGFGYNTAALVNAPLGDKAALRVSGFWRKDPGYVNSIGNDPIPTISGQLVPPGVPGFPPAGVPAVPLPAFELRTMVGEDINDEESYGGRASLLVEPTDNLSVRLTAFAQNMNSDASNVFMVDPETLDGLYGGRVQSSYGPEPTKIKYRVYSGEIDWDLGFANFLSSTSYSTFSEKLQTDGTFLLGQTVNLLAGLGPEAALLGLPVIADPAVRSPLGVEQFQETATDKFTQEFRLASPNNDTIEWLAGLFYTHEKSKIDPQNIFAVDINTDNIVPGIVPIAEIFLHSKYDEYAAFANATWHASPRFDLTVGGRLAHNEQTADLAITSDVVGNSSGTDLDSSETVFTFSIAPRYELTEHSSLYARVSTGYRPGGPNVVPIDNSPDLGVPLTYDADRLVNYEIGYKAESADRRLWTFEATLYHLDWKDIQLFARVNGTGVNVNGGKARINGLEMAGSLRPLRGLTLSANGAYINAKLTEDAPEAQGGQDGDWLPWVPRWSGALHGDYEFALGTGLDAFVGASVNYVGKRVTELNERTPPPDNDTISIPDYAQVDLRAGLNFDRWTVEAYAKNLFDAGGITNAFGFPDPVNGDTFPAGEAAVSTIRPRTFGLVATVRY